MSGVIVDKINACWVVKELDGVLDVHVLLGGGDGATLLMLRMEPWHFGQVQSFRLKPLIVPIGCS